MITLLHGNYIEASRNELNNLKGNDPDIEIRILNGATLNETSLVQALEANPIIAKKKTIIIENLFSQAAKKSPKNFEKFLARLCPAAHDCQIILWENREITAAALKNLGKEVRIQLFKLPVKIFQFLDNLKPDNSAYLLDTLRMVLTTEPAEVVLALLVRRIRQLMMLLDQISLKDLSSWQLSRLTNQAKYFTLEKLKLAEKKLLKAEYNFKTGNTPFNLRQLVEQFIIDL